MKSKEQVCVTKVCHCREMLSEIYNACHCQMKDNALLNECVEDPRYQPSGMTTSFTTTHGFTTYSVTPQGQYVGYNGRTGFTLIELLVVVLIIGILAAVAVPQYQKAVWKSRSAHLRTLQRGVSIAQNVYYEANGTYPTQFSQLDLSFDNLTPANQSTLNAHTQITDTDFVRYNDLFEVYLTPTGTTAWFREGKYKGCGFDIDFKTGKWSCLEWHFQYKGTPGSFCQQVMGAGPLIVDEQRVRFYTLAY